MISYQIGMTPKSTLAFLLLLSCSTLGSTLKNRYIRQDSGYTDTDCSANLNEKFVAAYPQCGNILGLENMETADWFQYLICDVNCGMPFLSLFVAQCPYKETLEIVEYYRGLCKVNEDGRPCYTYYKNSASDMNVVDPDITLQLCKPSIKYNICSDKCSSQLRAISTHYGLCIDPLFNSSYFHSFDVELLPLFSYQLWTNCGVPIPTAAVRRGRAKISIY